jgi:hypothetical protein
MSSISGLQYNLEKLEKLDTENDNSFKYLGDRLLKIGGIISNEKLHETKEKNIHDKVHCVSEAW